MVKMKRGRRTGYRESDATKAKRSKTMMGHTVSEETKIKIRNTMLVSGARKLSDKDVERMFVLYDAAEMKVSKIAELYDVSEKHFHALLKERSSAFVNNAVDADGEVGGD